MLQLEGKYNKDCKIFADDVEPQAISTILRILNHPISTGVPIRIQSDVHEGKGIVIGFTMPLNINNGLIPNIIGVDIGCGVIAASFPKSTKMDLEKINAKIIENVPTGANIHKENVFGDIPFDEPQKVADIFTVEFNKKFGTSYKAPTYNQDWLDQKLNDVGISDLIFYNSIGTLGSGNHYCELGSGSKDYWVTIHSGSRNFGLKIANYWTKVAEDSISKPTTEYNQKLDAIIQNTIDKKLIPEKIKELKKSFNLGINRNDAFLSGDDMMGYLYDMIFAQLYASWSRKTMLGIIQKVLKVKQFTETFETVHNYIDFNDFIIRKGAISSYIGQKMIIPLNMRDGVLLCEGKSNSDWNFSAPHGAGRIMSRGEAKQKVDLKKFQETMKGVYSTTVCKETLDESPFAYKKSSVIEAAIEPTAIILDKIKPILNIKDAGKQMSWKERREDKKHRKATQNKRRRR
jgi:RNA-splicing ligase RtcB